ncbi:MAG: hypothetical protein Q4D82_00240 [Neisseria sp.]|nr:hypothetical protein [Neisseria sp.]
MKTILSAILISLLAACSTYSGSSSGSNTFYGEIKSGVEISHTRVR